MLVSIPSRRWLPGTGIAADVRGRLPFYKDDWVQGCNWGIKVFAPAVYIFFASALPAIAFGQQFAVDTDGSLTVVHVLISTALAGLIQSIIGGQPLLIIGVAEPIVLIYGFMYTFCTNTPGLGRQLYLPWCAWVCVWTAIMCLLLAFSNACAGIDRFTRFCGELFGALIAILFLQVGVKGIVHEFQPAAATSAPAAVASSSNTSLLLLINGLWGLLLACGLLITSLKVLNARSWLVGRAWLRSFLADYGVPLLVVVWSALSFAVRPAQGVPRRVQTPNLWEVNDNWSVASKMIDVPGTYIAAALLPAAIITVLFYFDHNVSSQLAQQPEFNLKKPPAYHYDFFLLAAMTLICGLLGLPPVNGVLPQAPMHTRSAAHIRRCQPNQQQPDTAAAVYNVQLVAVDQPVACVEADGHIVLDSGSCVLASTAEAGPLSLDSTSSSTGKPGSCMHDSLEPPLGRSQVESIPCNPRIQLNGSVEPPVDSYCSHVGDVSCSPRIQLRDEERRSSGQLRHRHLHPQPQPSHALQHQQQQQLQQHQPHQQHQAQHHADLQPVATAMLPQQQHNEWQQKDGTVLREINSELQLDTLPDSAANGSSKQLSDDHPHNHDGCYLQLEVREQRVTNLIQSLLLCVCLGITPVIKLVPSAVLWGYFIFMAVESLTGSQLWERTKLLVTDPDKRIRVLQQEHAAYLQLVPHRIVVRFTQLQLVYLLGVWALTTWAGIAGVAFPLPIMALVPVRQYILPLLFKKQHLSQLDAASYEEAPPIVDRTQAQQELSAVGGVASALPVTTDETTKAGAETAADDSDMLQHEFVGYRLKHHLTAKDLEQQKSL